MFTFHTFARAPSPPVVAASERVTVRAARLYAACVPGPEGAVAKSQLDRLLARHGLEFAPLGTQTDTMYAVAAARECSGVEAVLLGTAWYVCGTPAQVRDAHAMARHLADRFAAAWERASDSGRMLARGLGGMLHHGMMVRVTFADLLGVAEDVGPLDRPTFMTVLGAVMYGSVCEAYGARRPPPPGIEVALQEAAERRAGSAAARSAQERDAPAATPAASTEEAGPSRRPPPRVADAMATAERSRRLALQFARECRPLALLFRLRPMQPALPPHDPATE